LHDEVRILIFDDPAENEGGQFYLYIIWALLHDEVRILIFDDPAENERRQRP
jgi:hypothetical protein